MGKTKKSKTNKSTYFRLNKNKKACPKDAYHLFNLAFTLAPLQSTSHCSNITVGPGHPSPLDSAQLPLQDLPTSTPQPRPLTSLALLPTTHKRRGPGGWWAHPGAA